MHIRNTACIAVGVAFRVVVVALVVTQPAADARSRRTRRVACEHDASKLLTLALGWSQLLDAALGCSSLFVIALGHPLLLQIAPHCSLLLFVGSLGSCWLRLVAARGRCSLPPADPRS